MLISAIASIIVIGGAILGFSFLAQFCWNVGVQWIVPSFPYMDYKNALAISAIGVIIQLLASHWYRRAVEVKYAIRLVKLLEGRNKR